MIASLFDLDQRVAIVTGASSGLGRRFAQVLAANGADVVAAARRKDRLDETATGYVNILPVECDVTDLAQCEVLVERTIREFGRLDILVNGAGISRPRKMEDETPDVFRSVLEVNLLGVYTVTHAAAAALRASGRASVINVASVGGLVGFGRMPQASYAASKGAVVNLTRELAAQWARAGIRVNALAPAFFESEMTAELFGAEKGAEWVDRMTPMGRRGAAHELDGALIYLASDASSYVTGSILAVDGGWTAV